MAIWYEPLEVSEYGKGIGRWRMTARSDEDNFPPRGLCSCADGHESPESARQCPEALAELERYFPRPADGAKSLRVAPGLPADTLDRLRAEVAFADAHGPRADHEPVTDSSLNYGDLRTLLRLLDRPAPPAEVPRG